MSSPGVRRPLVAASAMALLATITLAGSAVAATCTYAPGDFPIDVLRAGEVACGGPGNDHISLMRGGIFYGRDGNERISEMREASSTAVGAETGSAN